MAAYASLSSLSKSIHHLKIFLQTLDRDSSTLAAFSFPDGEERELQNEIESLAENVSFFRSFLAERASFLATHHRETRTTADLEARIRDAAIKTEDIIGSFLWEQHRSAYREGESIEEEKYLVCSQRRPDFAELCRRLHTVTGEISFLMNDIINISRNFTPADVDNSEIDDSSSSRQIEPTHTEEVVGLDFLCYCLKFLVMKESPALDAIPIVGDAGMGKTTLARMFFNHPSTFEAFQICVWVTVSKDFSARDILLSLARSIQPFIREPKLRNESLENHVRKNLKGRRFLVVLDDVWSGETLDFLMTIFPDDNNGSRIVLTTRMMKEVAIRASPTQRHLMMRGFPEEQSRDLLVRKVFKQEPCPDELEAYVRAMVSVCRGWPLLIVLVAGILCSIGKSKAKWSRTVDILSSSLIVEEYEYRGLDVILSLSYSHLPRCLRSCLLYMGAFPEDHEINVSKLTKLWLAQGFLQESNASSSSESCQAREYLHQLVRRNLVSVLNRKSDGDIKSCSLHDLVREFCLKKAREEGLFCYSSGEHLEGNRIRIASDSDNLERICGSGSDGAHTILCFRSFRSSLTSIGRFRLLKTLDAAHIQLKVFPLEIVELFLLRLLAINHVPELPSSISNLRYLETLIVHPIDDITFFPALPNIICLPSEIWTMSMLRHIVAFCCGALPNPEEGKCSSLENLETLSAVMNLDCSENTLKVIPNVKKLGIFYFGVERATHSLKNLERLHRLEKLKVWVMVPFSSPQNLDLGYPLTLKKLHLRGVHLSSQDMKIIGLLPALEVLKLGHNTFEGDEWRINHGEFAQLKALLLHELFLKHWVSDEDTFLPILQRLVVRACTHLCNIPKCVVEIQTLQLIEVSGGNKSLMGFARRMKDTMKDVGRCRVLIRS